MTNIEFLKPILGDELFAQVSEKLTASPEIALANIADGTHIPKAKFDEVNGKVKGLNTTIADLTAKLNAAQQLVGNTDTLNANIAELNAKLAAKQAEVERLGMGYKIKDALRGMNARNVDVIMPLLKTETITEKDGKLVGLEEQVNALKQTDGYLFADQPGIKGGFSGGTPDIGGAHNNNDIVNNAIRSMTGRG